MVVRFVDSTSGNDAWDGLAPVWVAGLNGPKASLNGAEDTPVVAGDLIHVRAGVYRELLTCDVSGAAGQAIEYRGDYTGAIWAGGVVRITGSNNDQTAARNYCIAGTLRDYRTFTGFQFDTTSSWLIYLNAAVADCCQNWVIQQCMFYGVSGANSISVTNNTIAPDLDNAITIQNCAFIGGLVGIGFANTNATTSTNLVQNCLFLSNAAGAAYGVYVNRIGGGIVKNCAFVGSNDYGIAIGALPVGYTAWTANNNVFYACATALRASVLGELVEDYNDVYGCATARSNVGVGANSLAYPPLFDSRWFFELVNGGDMVSPFDLASYSQLVNVAGWLPTATDMRGTGAIGGVRERGALEYDPTLLIRSAGGGAVSISPLRGNIG